VVRRTALRAFAALVSLVLLLLATGRAQAQIKASTVPVVAAASSEKDDEEAADSPRASMRSFFELADRGRYLEAAIYLDLPRGSEKRAAELTSKLHAVLSQRLFVDPEALSPLAQGRAGDGLPNGTEELGKIEDAKGHPIPIRLVRHESKAVDDEARWVFSQTTVAAIPTLYGLLRDRWIRERLPPSLLVHGPMALALWQWLALPILAAICFVVGRVLTFFSGYLGRWLLAGHTWSDRLLEGLKAPTTVGWGLAAFALLMSYLALSLRAEELLERGLRALAYLAFFWALLRVVTVVGDELRNADWSRTRPNARSLSAVGVSLGKVIVAALALMVAFTELGYPVTSIIAGLGIGGVALALAAQKTVENLFGSISILIDQPFKIGDTVRVDTIEGTVENIGLRSTRVRTADRTLVIFPNGKLADMRIESLGPRDRMRFATKLQLGRGTTPAQIRSIVADLKTKVMGQPLIRKEDVSVRLTGIGEVSYDIELSTALETLDANEYARIREEILLGCVEVIEKAGAKLAIPVRQLLAPNGSTTTSGTAQPSDSASGRS
jgi:MscS family membrane protein